MTEERNELLEYINNSLEKSFEKTAVIKETDKVQSVFTHIKKAEKIVKRTSANRNDEVFRCLKTGIFRI